ncbi:heme-binding protein [Halieaceae bacterium IMCC14734]|uniref:Heme-binding protein n=2 Tax=Candidatus Litorirhabdus singularis TaxID=2518993 RepID=A0ABT3TDX1_9GAMM|nr:heme-binding protein [Candidatus Litorirhabdus singularis]
MANSIEEPAYQMLYKLGDVELREYEPAIQAITVLPDNSGTNAGFRRLAGFIFGGNSSGESIAMTAPVQETLGSTKTTMAFTMPSAYNMEQLPEPSDQSVTLVKVPGRTAAVISFSGWATAGKIRKYTQQLRDALEQQSIAIAGDMTLNQYNPPWTPPFQRRNEIMVDIALSPLSQGDSN